jgi:hypothetical protein
MMGKGDGCGGEKVFAYWGVWERERNFDCICIFDAVEFVCHGRGAKRNEKTRIFGHSFFF